MTPRIFPQGSPPASYTIALAKLTSEFSEMLTWEEVTRLLFAGKFRAGVATANLLAARGGPFLPAERETLASMQKSVMLLQYDPRLTDKETAHYILRCDSSRLAPTNAEIASLLRARPEWP